MIITRDRLIFIDNPKCASSTMRTYYSQIRHKIIFQSMKRIDKCDYGYEDPDYVHANVAGIFRYLKTIGQIENFTCFTTIRNPYDRFWSNYRYYKKNNPDSAHTLETFMNRDQTKMFFPHNFRYYKGFGITNLIRVENLTEDLSKYNRLHNIGFKKIDNRRQNVSKNIVQDFCFTNKIVDYINKNYELDFIDGKYSFETAEDINKRLFGEQK